MQVAVERPVGPNLVCSQIKQTRPIEFVALLSLAHHGTGSIVMKNQIVAKTKILQLATAV
jgi:hypothetical protein